MIRIYSVVFPLFYFSTEAFIHRIMRIVFYRSLLHSGYNLTANERILYSFLASKSIMNMDNAFAQDGKNLNYDTLGYIFEDDSYVQMSYFSINTLSSILGISRRCIIDSLNMLKMMRIIDGDSILIDRGFIDEGYFELDTESGTKGELLIFYSFLKDKSSRYGCCIDTFKCKLAEQSDKSTISVKKMLNKLYKMGLIERMDDGKLKIKK